MTHSYRHTPIGGHGLAASDKADKQAAQQRWRHRVRQALHIGQYDRLPELREVSDVWGMAKDGKTAWSDNGLTGRAWWRMWGK